MTRRGYHHHTGVLAAGSILASCLPATASAAPVPVWQTVEITLQAANTYANPCTDP